jgi:hypothetical protein
VVVAIAAASIAGVIVSHGKRSPTTTSPDQSLTLTPLAASVTHSAELTLAGRTTDLTVSGTIPVLGKAVTVDGTGEIDFDTNAMDIDMHMDGPGGLVEYQSVLVDGNLYYTASDNGSGIAKVTGGPTWIQMPAQQSATTDLAGSDPVSSLLLLEQQGSTVRPLGSKTIDGVTCTGFAVTPSTQAMVAETREEDAKAGLSAAAINQDVQQAQQTPPPTITVWSDAQGFVHEISVTLQINVSIQGAAASDGYLLMDFSHIGAPVSIAAPPPSDTISYSSFLQDLGNKPA